VINITLGTPHRGALSALETQVNGVEVKLLDSSRVSFGVLAPKLSRLARSLPSLFQLLPEYACIETVAGLVSAGTRPMRRRIAASLERSQ